MKKFALILLLMSIFYTSAYAMELPEMDGEYTFNEITNQIASGEFSLNPIDIFNRVVNQFFKEMRESADIMVTFIMIAALSAILTIVQGALKDGGVSEAAFLACFTLMSAGAVKSLIIALGYGTNVIKAMSEFVTKLSPMLIALVLSCGGIASAAAFKPALLAGVYMITIIVEKCIVPLITFGAVLAIVNNISGKTQVSNFTSLIQSVSKWILTAVLTVFTGITAVYGFTTPGLDALSAKTVKFAVGSLVPVVGGLLSDAVETVVGGSMLMKNAVGSAGVIMICTICMIPIMKIAVIVIMLKLSAAAAEPLADKRIVGMLSDVSNVVTTILSMVITVAVMFIINVSIIISATNIVR
ncbi:MAG: stage III sporulation protein AE [Clostridia bacterium]|nr:stage III sporulation protein AE [Clostridia bacterium]